MSNFGPESSDNDTQSHAWQRIDDDSIPSHIESLQSDEIIVSFNTAYSTSKEVTSFRVKYDHLLSSPSLVSVLLSQTTMSFACDDERIIQSVMDRAKAIHVGSSNRVLTTYMTAVDDDLSHNVDSDDDDYEFATVQVLQGFETMKIEGSEARLEHCPICLEEFSKGSEATRMPCSHVYHRGCIYQWLVKGSSCPLCRGKVS